MGIIATLVVMTGCRDRSHLARITLASQPNSPVFYLEVVSTPDERGRGLMFRNTIPSDGGMVFVFPDDDGSPFWMKNTFVSLDIIFIDSTFHVVHVAESTTPMSERLILSPVSYRYVIELPAGSAKKHGIRDGVAFKIEWPTDR